MYVCGVTPYDATHLGHAATYLAFDVLNRAWRDSGHDVRYVQNVTDEKALLSYASAGAPGSPLSPGMAGEFYGSAVILPPRTVGLRIGYTF